MSQRSGDEPISGTAQRGAREGGPAAEPRLRVGVHRSLAELRELEKPWRALYAERRDASPFLDLDWICTWTELFAHGRARPHVLSVREGEEIIGIAPWMQVEPARRSEPRRLVFLGEQHTAGDYLDALCAVQREPDVAGALFAHLWGEGEASWQALELRGMPAGSAFLFHLGECFERAGKHVEIRADAYCPRRRLEPGSALESDPALRRMRLRYHRQRLERAGAVRHEMRASADPEFPAALAELAALHRLRWGGETAALRCVEAYARQVGAEGRLRVDLLRVDERAVAGLLHLPRGEVLHMYLMAVDREAVRNVSLGNVLLAEVLERASAEGLRVYDFMRGGEEYKHRWSNTAERCLVLRAQRRSASALGELALRSLRDWVKAAWR